MEGVNLNVISVYVALVFSENRLFTSKLFRGIPLRCAQRNVEWNGITKDYNRLTFEISGKFIFSIWDGNRWIQEGPEGKKGEGKKPRASDQMVWPMASTCKRNCQVRMQNTIQYI